MDDVLEILREYPADCRSTAIEPLGMAGGLSGAHFWRIAAQRGMLALRRWPAEHPTPNRLAFIHAVLYHAAGRGMTILPAPIATAAGETFVERDGHLWELAPWLPGMADYQRSPCTEKLRAALRAVAKFHLAVADFDRTAAPGSAGLPPACTHRLARLVGLQRGGIERLSEAIDDSVWPELAPLSLRAVAELPRVVPIAIARLAPLADVQLPLQVCIRDIWHDHVLFVGDGVTGLIDFGAMQVDTPATDVARLLGSLAGDDRKCWQTGLDAYSEVRLLSDLESAAVFPLDTAGTVLALCNWIRWIYVEHRHIDDRAPLLNRIAKLLDRLYNVR